MAFIINDAKRIVSLIIGRINRLKTDILIKHTKNNLTKKDFSIISQNCIGGVFYHDMGLQFTSPTINLFFSGPDFIKFVQKIDYYLREKIVIKWGEDYPLGYLDDIVVHFQHYKTCSEAKEKWEIRKSRVIRDKIIVLCTDRDGFDEVAYNEWKKIAFPKILFTATRREDPETIFYPEYCKTGSVDDLISTRKFYKDDILINTIERL